MQIGQQIKTQRELKHWSQQDLANRLNISHQSISKWEQGTALPSFSNVVLLSDLFGLSIDEFVRQDTHLMNKLAHPTDRPFSLVLLLSFGCAVITSLISLSIGIDETTFIDGTQSFILIGVIVLLFLVYSQQRQNKSHHTWLMVGIAIITLALLLVPQVDSFFFGFYSGLLHPLHTV